MAALAASSPAWCRVCWGAVAPAPWSPRALHGLLEGGRHQDVLTFILTQFRGLLLAKEDQLRAVIAERVREQGGRLVGWALGAQVARRVLTALNGELDKVGPDGSELRDAFDAWMRAEILRMETDPERAAEVGRAIRQVVAHDTVQAWLWDIWARLRLAMEADAARPGGHTVAFIEGALANFGSLLESDPAVRARLQGAVETVVLTVLPSARASLSTFIGDVVSNWGHRDPGGPAGTAGRQGTFSMFGSTAPSSGSWWAAPCMVSCGQFLATRLSDPLPC